MFEGFELVERAFGQQGELAGVDLVAGDRQHDVAGVRQHAQHHDEQVRLQSLLVRIKVLDIRAARDEFVAVEHLPVALCRKPLQHFLRIARMGRVDAFAVQHFQRIEHGGGVLGARAARQCAQRAADEGFAVGLGDQHGKLGVIRRDVGKTLAQHQA